MRFKDFLITILISTITSLIVIWTLINAGIIPTPQQYPKIYLKQTHLGTLVGLLNQTSKIYEAEIDRISIENVSEKTSLRLLHISLEARVTNFGREILDINHLKLTDQTLQRVISEKSVRFASNYTFLTIDTSVNPVHTYYISLKATGTYNFTLTYNLMIIQEVFT